MIQIHSDSPPDQIAQRPNPAPFLLHPVLQLADHESRKKNEAFGARNKTKSLIRYDTSGCRQMRQRHPQQQKPAQDIELDQAPASRFWREPDLLAGPKSLLEKECHAAPWLSV